MKRKVALVLTALVMGSLLSYSNKCRTVCDGRATYVAPVANAQAESEKNTEQNETTSPLLRIATYL